MILGWVERVELLRKAASVLDGQAMPSWMLGRHFNWRLQQVVQLPLHKLTDWRYHDHLSEGITGRVRPDPGRNRLLPWQDCI